MSRHTYPFSVADWHSLGFVHPLVMDLMDFQQITRFELSTAKNFIEAFYINDRNQPDVYLCLNTQPPEILHLVVMKLNLLLSPRTRT